MYQRMHASTVCTVWNWQEFLLRFSENFVQMPLHRRFADFQFNEQEEQKKEAQFIFTQLPASVLIKLN